MAESSENQRIPRSSIDRIIRRALHMESAEQDTVSLADLRAAAAEAGIEGDVIQRAIDEEAAALKRERRAAAQREQRLRRFRRQLGGTAALVAVLFGIDWMTGGGWWFQWPLLGLCIGLVLRARWLYLPAGSRRGGVGACS